jgi:predicted enzyme related to lactoylglutathione lyase
VGVRDGYAPGQFSWVELATPDAVAAKAFYAELFGWTYEDRPVGAGAVYSMAGLDGRRVAAVYASEQAAAHWNCYVTVASVDAAAEACAAAGGTVAAEPFDVLTAGRMTVVQDPTGAPLCLWEAREHAGAGLVNVPGALTWNDLFTTDVPAAGAFYAAALGWEVEAVPGAPGDRRAIRAGGRPNGGITAMPPGAEGTPPHWLAYFGTADAAASVEVVGRAGGRVLAGPLEVPAGAFAVCADPQGAVFGLFAGVFDD